MKSSSDQPAPGKCGRPRTFDEEQALDCAMRVFWEKGYEGSSLPELTKAMGMNRPSLYAVFGNKEQLFRRAVEHYEATRGPQRDAALAEPRARAVVERLLRMAADMQTEPDKPHGCLGINGALACGDEAAPLRDYLVERRALGYELLRQRLERARDENDLPAHADPAKLARFFVTVSQGMAVQAAGGAGRAELHEVVDAALAAWPV